MAETPQKKAGKSPPHTEGKNSVVQRASLDRLASMLIHGGAPREESRVAAVLRLLADLGLFRRGAVLAGRQAFRAYSNLLSVRLPSAALRTQDIDVAHSVDVALAAACEPVMHVEAALAKRGMLPVPGLDPRRPSTSFYMRGQELRVDFLTPGRRGTEESPVLVPGLGLSAWPLPFLDYLIEEPVPAVILDSSPIMVRVPRPGRFVLHKLWTASTRPAAEHAKAVPLFKLRVHRGARRILHQGNHDWCRQYLNPAAAQMPGSMGFFHREFGFPSQPWFNICHHIPLKRNTLI